MNLHSKLRLFHRKISPWLLPSILFIAITGMSYRIGRAWFGMSKETGGKVLHLHSGEWLGNHGSVIYLFVIGGALIFLIFSGLWMIFAAKSPKVPVRKVHRVLAIIFSLPLLISAVTGIAYQMGGKWFGADKEVLKFLLSIHQGSWLGNTWRPFYILFLGLGLIGLCLTGIRMVIRNRPTNKARLQK